MKPDYGRDFLIGIWEDHKPTGIEFVVQLKGQAHVSLNKKKTHAKFKFEVKYLNYYMSLAWPVFLVVVDISTKLGYWVFLQQYVVQSPQSLKKRTKKHLTIQLPTAPLISDAVALQKAATEAREYMISIQPSSIENAIKGQKASYEKLDPRVEAKIDVIDGKQRVTIEPKEPIQLQFFFDGKAPSMDDRLRDFFGRGMPLHLEPAEARVEGSKLFEDLFTQGGTLELKSHVPAAVSLIAKSDTGHEIASLKNLSATIEGGFLEVRVSGGLPGSPFSLNLTMTKDSTHGPMGVRFDLPSWRDHLIAQLPFFDQLAEFLIPLKDAAIVEAQVFVNGNRAIRGSIDDAVGLKTIKRLSALFQILRDAQEIARIANIAPILNEDIDHEMANDIYEMHGLLTKGEVRRKAVNFRYLHKFPRQVVKDMVEGLSSQEATLSLISNNEQTGRLFGYSVPLGKLEISITNMKVATPDSILRKKLKTRQQHIQVELVGTSNAVRTIKILHAGSAPVDGN